MYRFSLIWLVLIATATSAQSLKRTGLSLVAPAQTTCTPVKNQFLSATCWSFSSNSLLESELLKKGIDMDLSEMFVARYSLVRKIHRHLQLKGQNFFTPGGQFHDMIWVMKNHGMVPESAYDGRPAKELNHNHGELDTLLSHFVKKLVAEGVTVMDRRQEKYVDSLLDHYLGVVPDHFVYKGDIYTPQSFVERVLEFNADDYVEITSYTHHPFYTRFVLEDKYNWTGDEYYNVTLADFSRITDNALSKGYTVGWDGDAMDEGFDYDEGLAYLPDSLSKGPMQVVRQKAFESEATLLDHMMHIVAKTKDRSGRIWYYIKNSWGVYSNPIGGFLFMREDYFKIRTVAIIVNKNAIPPDIRSQLGI